MTLPIMQKETYIWGAGHYGVLTALDLENKGVRVKGFIDKNAKMIKMRLGLPVLELDEIESKNPQIIIAVQNEDAVRKIIEILLLTGLRKNIDFKISSLIPVPLGYFDSVDDEIDYYRNILKERNDIYLYDEEIAKNLADVWNGTMNKPPNLRFIENAIPVALCANESFAPYLAVMLQSLLDNSNLHRKYHFIILERNFSAKTKNYLISQVLKFSHCEIDFIDIAPTFDGIPIVPSYHLSIDAFSRLFIPYWFDKYPKVIYLDSDMIARTDIAELYDLDISNFCMGIVPSPAAAWCLKHRDYTFFLNSTAILIFIENLSRYINSGVLVFDTRKFREKISYQNLFRFAIYFTNRYAKHLGDQDVLASLIKDDYFPLPLEWNYPWRIKGSYQTAKSDTKIIHFLTNIKPWQNVPEIEYHPATIEYRNYAMKVPLYRDCSVT